MITREIKVGDRLRHLNGARIVVAKIADHGGTLFDANDNCWHSPFIKPENWFHIDEPEATADPVNRPPHYTQGEIECIDAIRSALGPEGFQAYCRGNVIKYAWRCEAKGKIEDLAKAAWYMNTAIEARKEQAK